MNNSLKRTFDGEGFVRNVLPPTRSLMRTDCRHETLFQKPLTNSKYFKSSSLDIETHFESKPLEQKFNRVPCCARNMRCDHNLKTAYFELDHLSTNHGAELICSHEKCRNTGIKFLYCRQCKGPVPKRNFAKLHSHKVSSIVHGTKMVTSATHKELMADNFLLHQIPMKIEPSDNISTMRIPISRNNVVIDINCNGSSMINMKANGLQNQGLDDKILSRKYLERRWIGLLLERPETKDSAEVSKWLRKVLILSDEWLSIRNVT